MQSALLVNQQPINPVQIVINYINTVFKQTNKKNPLANAQLADISIGSNRLMFSHAISIDPVVNARVYKTIRT